MRIFLGLIVLSLFLLGCQSIQTLKIEQADSISLSKMDKGKLLLNWEPLINNPNAFAMKLKSAKVDVSLEDELVGKAVITTEKVKFLAKSQQKYSIPIEVNLEEGALFKLLRYAFKPQVKLQIKGLVKGTAFGFPKRMKIDETKLIPGFILNKLK